MGSSLGVACARRERISWQLSDFGSTFDAYFEMYEDNMSRNNKLAINIIPPY